jgi:glycerophosphoryl diester phosphodiesterase
MPTHGWGVDCIAHRGFAAVNPENTVAAVRAASARADVVEVDVRRCGSGEVVVCHDATVDRVTDGSGAVADLALTALQALVVQGSGEGIPPLRAVVDAVPPGVDLNIELKEAGLERAVLDACADRDRPPLLSSFDAGHLAAAAAAGADRLAILGGEEGDALLRTARQLDCEAVHPAAALVTPALVDRAHAAGVAVNAWTVRSRGTAAWLDACGVDGCIADAPADCGPA